MMAGENSLPVGDFPLWLRRISRVSFVRARARHFRRSRTGTFAVGEVYPRKGRDESHAALARQPASDIRH